MRILEICPFSAGICGVWIRAFEESRRLSKLGHEVRIFSSNFVKGKNEKAKKEEIIKGLSVKRFNAFKLGGESFMYWNFEKEALAYEPQVIIAHNYRHLHTTKAIKIAEKLRKEGKSCKVYLVTHAPFVEGNITRSFVSTLFVNLYDYFIGLRKINKFDKIFAISKWEVPYLLKLGAEKNKIKYIPNGIPAEFFEQKKAKEENKIIFLGRIAMKKKIETLIEAIPLIKDKKITLEIIGPADEEYFNYLKSLVNKLALEKKVFFKIPIYDIREKIRKIDSGKIYVLPSRVEGMPQSLIEAMARSKIVIGSNSVAIRDLIKNGKNGYLFEFDNPRDLANKIDLAILSKNNEIGNRARKSVEKFSWNKVIREIEKAISS